MTQKSIKLVMIRRGSIITPNVSTLKLVSFIRKRILLGADEISSDGKNWIRVDHHYQLRNFFSETDCHSKILKANIGVNEEVGFSERAAGFENDLQEVANLLWEINK